MFRIRKIFSAGEIVLWSVSAVLILISFLIFDRAGYLTLSASLVGVTSLLFNAKGHPFGQVLMILFSTLYAVISFRFSYYGEMITYMGMTAPMALIALIAWLKNPYKGNRAQVKVNRLVKKEVWFMLLLTLAVTTVFYYILRAFHTVNLIPGTVSVFTSFLAAYLTFRRSAWFAAAYAANDMVLILLWILASLTDLSYLSVVICFLLFLLHDLYGLFSWLGMRKKQEEN